MEIDGRDLQNKLNYLGMERDVRQLALDDKLDTPENIAVMSTTEVCNLVAEKYVLLYADSEELGLVDKDTYDSICEHIKRICR